MDLGIRGRTTCCPIPTGCARAWSLPHAARAAQRRSFGNARTELKVLPVELRMVPVKVGIVTMNNRTLSPVAKLFIERARDVAKRLIER
jgi:hypothetical protein